MAENWGRLLDLMGWIAITVTAIKGVQYLVALLPTSKLSKQVKANTKKIEEEHDHLEKVDIRLDDLNKRLDENQQNQTEEIKLINQSLNMLGKSQISMLRHFIDGNGKEEMKKEAEKLTEFFIDK